jgi:hypothetical protein
MLLTLFRSTDALRHLHRSGCPNRGMDDCSEDPCGIGVLADERPPPSRARRTCHGACLRCFRVPPRGMDDCLEDWSVRAPQPSANGVSRCRGIDSRDGCPTVASLAFERSAEAAVRKVAGSVISIVPGRGRGHVQLLGYEVECLSWLAAAGHVTVGLPMLIVRHPSGRPGMEGQGHAAQG